MTGRTCVVTIEITGAVNVGTITPAHGRILDALQNNDTVLLDLSKTGDCDITLVQLVEAARSHAAATAKTLSLAHPLSRNLSRVLERGGFLATGESRAFWLGERV